MTEKKNKLYYIATYTIIIVLLFVSNFSNAQYFGRNKPNYGSFRYKVYKTPHFEIYHYLKNDSMLNVIAKSAEIWYEMHKVNFKDSFYKQNPLLIYANHADFQQTTAIMGQVDVGTGGVTEPLRNRVIMPLAETTSQTQHVLGHELVHAFQFNMLFNSNDTTNRYSMRNLVLWQVEGMAEYYSIGSVDANTAMWIRDDILNKSFPSIEDLNTNPKYFPYRYGQAFWSMIGKTWGDTTIMNLFKATAKYGYEKAIDTVFHFGEKNLSGMWKAATLSHFKKFMHDTIDYPIGKKILSNETSGEYNVSPSISPDGKYIIYLTEKNIFSMELYLADALTGKVIRKISKTDKNTGFDAMNTLESSGTWSPDSKKFAFVVFSKGKTKLVIVDVNKGRIKDEFTVPGVDYFTNPSWSPDGKKIAFAGIVNGKSNLYLYDINYEKLERITNDKYCYVQPSWSSDGKTIVCTTDKPQENQKETKYFSYNIALIDLTNSNKIRVLNLFNTAENVNPAFSTDNKSIFFLSNSDGFRNLYRYYIDSAKVYRLTNYLTGISGITSLSTALSVARNTDRMVYSYYFNHKYTIYSAQSNEFNYQPVNKDSVNFDAATLPPLQHIGKNIVDSSIQYFSKRKPIFSDSFKTEKYKPKFKLDYISNVQVGMATSRFGTAMAGSVDMLFSDMVGYNLLYAGLALNGEIYDFGGVISYINQKNTINWGATFSHIPYRSAGYGYKIDTVTYEKEYIVDNFYLDYLRVFEDKISLFAFYPLSQIKRFEVSIASSWYGYKIQRINNYYYNGYKIDETKDDLPAPSGFNIQNVSTAYVEDNSVFGIASPFQGRRARIEFEKYFGALDYYGALIDYRYYLYAKPVCIAFRFMHYGRYGKDAENGKLTPLFLGYPWYMRGYDSNEYYDAQIGTSTSLTTDPLIGSRIALFNFEIRIPFTGPKQVSVISSKFLFTELALFWDSGLAWTENDQPSWKWKSSKQGERIPVHSVGLSIRINVFGAMILEPFYAFPLQAEKVKGSWGFNFWPGW